NKYEYSSFDKSNKNFLESSMANSMTFQNDNIIQYSRDIQKNRFSIMLGQSLEEKSSYSIGGSGASIPVPDKYHWYLSQTTEDRTYASDGASRTRMFSLFSRLFYSYDGKYMVTVNFRADNTSRFTENPWGYFPSAALSWNLSEEKFMKRFSKMDYLKIRGGWGMLGNQEIGQDDFTQLMFTSGPTFVDYILGADQLYENALGATVLTYVNTGGKWETTSQWNVGIDFGFWNGMLTGTIDGYIRNTSDMLMSVNAPAQVGNRYSAIKNVGSVLNEGIELSLGHRNSVGDFSYSIDGNISFVKNELTALNGGSTVYLDGIRVCDEGLPLYTIWGYKYLGVYKSNEEANTYLPNSSIPVSAGDSKYEDLNGDGNIDDADKANLGNPFPWLTYGLNFSADYKGFDLQLFFQGVVGNELYNALRVRTEGSGTECTLSTTMRDVWSTSNPDGSIPNPKNSYNSQVSSRFVESGDYFRLKNLQLGYTVPKRIMSKAHINRLRFYVSISNLFTITDYSGYDPEVAGGVDYGNYPQARTFLFGLNLDF
ncbi:MAG TPA: SusC/RagA family TonB-linked outer membrane protein, partial [Candidatus Enterocola sp.]|nr:SusC/RagA family TonB-linked outer membrane protein [Candidatus Enterocola sp.]